MKLRFGSVCSGIEAASVAWGTLGFEAAWFAEIEQFPCAVLRHHYPTVPNEGDLRFMALKVALGDIEAPDLLVGGTPCQSFSIAGMRKGLSDARGQLTLNYVQLANEIDKARITRGDKESIIVWENVPGVLSSRDNAFGCFLAALAGEAEPYPIPEGKSWSKSGVVFGPQRTVAWRVLDAQYFGVAQRRRRVFVVASARTDFHPVQVLLEFDGMRRDSAPSREAGEGTSTCATSSPAGSSVVGTLGCNTGPNGHGFGDFLNNQAIDAGHVIQQPLHDKTTVPVAFHPTQDPISSTDGTTHCMGTGSSQGGATVAVAYTTKMHNTGSNNAGKIFEERTTCLDANSPPPALLTATQVRRLTPVECERLQGFPDNYTAIPWRKKPARECPDGPRYKALGNSMAVPCMRWVGKRIVCALKRSWLDPDEQI